MKLDDISPIEFSTPAAIQKILKQWVQGNTAKIGTLKIRKADRYVETGTALYRGVELSPEDFAALNSGETIELPSKGFSSWSEDAQIAKDFAFGSGGSYGAVFKRDASKLSIWLNIDLFIFRNKLQALSTEREIIVKDTQASLRFSKIDTLQV